MEVENCVVLCEDCHYRVHQDGRYQNGAVAGPDYYPYSHGRKNSADHNAWAKSIDAKAKQLFVDVQKRKLATELRNLIESLAHALDMNSSEHRSQLDLVTHSIAGFWTNRLFNSTPPPMTIWNNAFGRLAAAKGAFRRNDLKTAFHELILAQVHYTAAFRWYSWWKNGIEGAGTKAQIAIGAAAFVTVCSLVAAYAVAAGAAATEAAAASTAVAQNLARAEAALLSTEMSVIESEQVFIRVEEKILERELLNEAELELEQYLAGTL
jgi:hypothetical protein